MNLRTAITDYIRYRVGRTPKAKLKVGYVLKSFALCCPGGIDLDKVKPRHVTKYIQYCIEQKGNHTNTIITNIKIISGFWKWCADNEMTTNYPIRPIHRFKHEETAPYHVMSEDNFQKLFEAADNLRDQAIITLAYYYGFRRGEILNLKRSDIDYEGLTIFVKGKGGKEAFIPILQDVTLLKAASYIGENRKSPYLICTRTGKRLSEGYFHGWWKRLLKKAGLPDTYRFHDLRHSFATKLIRKKIPLPIVQKFLRHSDIKTTMRYVHLDDSDMRKWLEEIYKEKKDDDQYTNN